MVSAARKALFERFEALGIAHQTYDHEPIFTVEQGKHLKAQWPGGHSKNLFLKDKKGNLVLISAKDETEVPLKRLHHHLDVGRLSFGSAELMEEVLGVRPGSVTIFALMNDEAKRLDHVILDAALMASDPVHFHPLENTGTTAISPADLLRFIADCGFEAEVMDFSALGEIPPRALKPPFQGLARGLCQDPRQSHKEFTPWRSAKTPPAVTTSNSSRIPTRRALPPMCWRPP